MSKNHWSKDIEEDLILLIKDWLKQTGRTQAELCQSLNLTSSRMTSLIEFFKTDFSFGGIPIVAKRLCEVEETWNTDESGEAKKSLELNSAGQLDLLDEICDDLSKITFNN